MGHSPLNHRTQDVTLDLKEQTQTPAGNDETVIRSPTINTTNRMTQKEHVNVHQTIPEWVLPLEAQKRLLQAGEGFKPDLLFIKGAPSPTPAVVTDIHLSQWKVTVVEVGFCADLRLKAKKEEKTTKYAPLIKELKDRWKNVHLITVPIGNAGAMLDSTKAELGELISTQPRKKTEQKRAEQLAKTLAITAARRLYGITVEYYRLRRETARQQTQKEPEDRRHTKPKAPPQSLDRQAGPAKRQRTYTPDNRLPLQSARAPATRGEGIKNQPLSRTFNGPATRRKPLLEATRRRAPTPPGSRNTQYSQRTLDRQPG